MKTLTIGSKIHSIDASHVGDLIRVLGLPDEGRGIAIAVNDRVVLRSQWKEKELQNGDRIEIVRAVQGG